MALTPLVRVRMLRHVSNYVQVLELEMGETYELTAAHAEQFITNGTAVKADAEPELEAAALRSARRRG